MKLIITIYILGCFVSAFHLVNHSKFEEMINRDSYTATAIALIISCMIWPYNLPGDICRFIKAWIMARKARRFMNRKN